MSSPSKRAWRFLRQIPEFGDPMPQLILTGGDPLAPQGSVSN